MPEIITNSDTPITQSDCDTLKQICDDYGTCQFYNHHCKNDHTDCNHGTEKLTGEQAHDHKHNDGEF